MHSKTVLWRILFVVLATFGGLAGCSFAPQRYMMIQDEALTLSKGDLEKSCLAFITPSTVTGQEENRQALALAFARVVQSKRPNLRVLTLPQTLGAVNKAGLAENYKQMYDEYRNTGIFRRTTLQQIADATGCRYLAQLNLATFQQSSDNRFGALGFRIVQTKQANIRQFLQIWDAQEGTIAWEGSQEYKYTDETVTERSVTFKTVIEETAQAMIDKLP